MRFKSIVDVFMDHAHRRPGRVAARAKRDGAYRAFTWGQLEEQVSAVARGLIGLGVAPGDRVAILANTSLEWVLTDLGIVAAAAVTVPIYPSSVATEVQYIATHAGAVVLFAEDAAQVSKLKMERAQLPSVRRVVQMRGSVEGAHDWVMSFADFLAQGRSGPVLTERRSALRRDSAATIIYTSGTTGNPKGVVLTHGALLYEAEAATELGVVRDDDVQFLFLPLAHSLGKVLVIGWLATGHVLAFAESIGTIMENLAETRPTLMAAVPRIFEKIYAAMVHKGLSEGGVRGRLFRAALDISERHGDAESRGESLAPAESLEFAALKRLVFARVGKGLQQALGGRMRLLVSGGAPLSPRIGWMFRDAGMLILEGYGLTESGAASTVNLPDAYRIGTVGKALPGTEIRIAADGEVLIRGGGLMREYWRDAEATREMLDADGWLHTGDIGTLESSGHLRITDRKKDLIVTAGGKNVAPQNLENLLKDQPLISQAVVHGDRRKFLSALITLDDAALRRFAKAHGLPDLSYAELSQHPDVYRTVEQGVQAVNRQLASYESIKRFQILPHDFSVDSGELTPSLKVKRKVVDDRYRSIFDSFYEDRF